jgi:hypothetical protein
LHAERVEAPTVVDGALRPPIAGASESFPPLVASSRWHAALADLNLAIERTRKQGGERAQVADRCASLVHAAAESVPRLERAARAAGDLQARVDLLEAMGREFRVSLGRAIDTLVHDRSREIAHLEALRGAGMHDEGARARAVVDDLSFQIRTLEHQLAARNEEHERAYVEAVGALEGSLSAVRVLRAEVTRRIDEAATVLAGAPR